MKLPRKKSITAHKDSSTNNETLQRKPKMAIVIHGWPLPFEVDAEEFKRLFYLGYRRGDIAFMEPEDRTRILDGKIPAGQLSGKRGGAR